MTHRRPKQRYHTEAAKAALRVALREARVNDLTQTIADALHSIPTHRTSDLIDDLRPTDVSITSHGTILITHLPHHTFEVTVRETPTPSTTHPFSTESESWESLTSALAEVVKRQPPEEAQ